MPHLTKLLIFGWIWAASHALVAQSTLSLSTQLGVPEGDFAEAGYAETFGFGIQATMREGPRILGFEWYNGVRLTYNFSRATRLDFGEGYSLRNQNTGFYLTSRLISPRGKIRVFVEGLAGGRQLFTTKRFYREEVIDPIQEVTHHQMNFSAGLGGGVCIRLGKRTSLEAQYTRWLGSPTQFIDAKRAQLIGGQVKFPLKDASDSNFDTYQIGFVIEMGKIDKKEKKKRRREKIAPEIKEVAPEEEGDENMDPEERG